MLKYVFLYIESDIGKETERKNINETNLDFSWSPVQKICLQ